MATFFRTKTGRGIALAAGLLLIVALGIVPVITLVVIVAVACLVELWSFTRVWSDARRHYPKVWDLTLGLQVALVIGGAVATVYIIEGYGLWLTMVIIVGIYIENAAAQIFGKKFGKNALAPHISPNKTWEGLIAGYVFGLIAAVLLLIAYDKWSAGVAPAPVWIAIVFMAPILAEVGDLIESHAKRLVSVKESSEITHESSPFIRIASLSWLFGRQGGALDKTDSLWLVMCASALLLAVFG